MKDKLKGAFHGCPHHGDDYESCIQHSGTAPCGVEEESDALAAHVERISRKIGHAPPIDNPTIAKWECDLNRLLEDSPETSLTHLKAQWQAEAIEEIGLNLVDIIDRDYARRVARKLRRQSQEPNQ